MCPLATSAVDVDVPSPHSPSKTDVDTLVVGEGDAEVQRRRMGEGSGAQCPNPSPIRGRGPCEDALSHKGRGHKYCHRARGSFARGRIPMTDIALDTTVIPRADERAESPVRGALRRL